MTTHRKETAMRTKSVAITSIICATITLLVIIGSLTKKQSPATASTPTISAPAAPALAAKAIHKAVKAIPKASPILLPSYLAHPCESEDSVNCFWDASKRGNHKGHSFFAILMHDGMGTICLIYTDRTYARTHNDCS